MKLLSKHVHSEDTIREYITTHLDATLTDTLESKEYDKYDIIPTIATIEDQINIFGAATTIDERRKALVDLYITTVFGLILLRADRITPSLKAHIWSVSGLELEHIVSSNTTVEQMLLRSPSKEVYADELLLENRYTALEHIAGVTDVLSGIYNSLVTDSAKELDEGHIEYVTDGFGILFLTLIDVITSRGYPVERDVEAVLESYINNTDINFAKLYSGFDEQATNELDKALTIMLSEPAEAEFEEMDHNED